MVLGLAFTLVFSFLAQQILQSVWALYTEGRYGWSPLDIGISLGLVGLATALVQGGLLRVMMPRLGERRTLIFGTIASAVGFVALGLASTGWLAYVLIFLRAPRRRLAGRAVADPTRRRQRAGRAAGVARQLDERHRHRRAPHRHPPLRAVRRSDLGAVRARDGLLHRGRARPLRPGPGAASLRAPPRGTRARSSRELGPTDGAITSRRAALSVGSRRRNRRIGASAAAGRRRLARDGGALEATFDRLEAIEEGGREARRVRIDRGSSRRGAVLELASRRSIASSRSATGHYVAKSEERPIPSGTASVSYELGGRGLALRRLQGGHGPCRRDPRTSKNRPCAPSYGVRSNT